TRTDEQLSAPRHPQRIQGRPRRDDVEPTGRRAHQAHHAEAPSADSVAADGRRRADLKMETGKLTRKCRSQIAFAPPEAPASFPPFISARQRTLADGVKVAQGTLTPLV